MAESRSEFVEKQQPASGLVGSSKVGPEAGPHETTGLTSDSPPPYAEVVPTAPARTHTADKAAAFEHATSHPEPVAESVVNRQEIVEAFSRISPHKIVAERDIAVVKELVETMLRYQEEQGSGVPSTALQKQVTLAKVLQSYQLGSLQSLLNTYTPHLQLPSAGVDDEQSVVRVTEQPRTPQPGPVIRVTEQPGTPQPEPVIGVVLQQQPGICQPGVGVIAQPTINPPDPNRVTIGTWPSSHTYPRYDAYGRPIPTITNQQVTYAYADQIPQLITVTAVLMVICCVVGSPLSLFCTIPGLHWIRKAKSDAQNPEKIEGAKFNFKRWKISFMVLIFVSFAFIPLVVLLTIGLGASLGTMASFRQQQTFLHFNHNDFFNG